MTPERRNRLRAVGRVNLSIAPPVPEMPTPLRSGSIEAVTCVTRATRNHGPPGSASSPSGTGDAGDDRGLGHVDPLAEVEERAAIAQHEGGFPARFALAFARLQLEQPKEIDAALWQTAVDAMGWLLDQSRDLAHAGGTGDTGDGWADFADQRIER